MTAFELKVTERTPIADSSLGAEALISSLEAMGRFRQVNLVKMAEAKRLYIREFLSPRKIKEKVGVSMSDIERWAITMGWDEEREQFELDMFRKIGAIRSNYVPNIDKVHDRLFASLELLIEDTITRAKEYDDEDEDSEPVKPAHLVSMANALKVCMDARRTIQGKASDHKTLAIELLNREGVLENFKAMAGELAIEDAAPRSKNLELGDLVDGEFTVLPDHESVEDIDAEDEIDAYDDED